MFERNELQTLRKKASIMARTEGLNVRWKRAYERLEDSANELDAMMARLEHQAIEK